MLNIGPKWVSHQLKIPNIYIEKQSLNHWTFVIQHGLESVGFLFENNISFVLNPSMYAELYIKMNWR